MLSVIIPAYNEEAALIEATKTIHTILSDSEIEHELIFVNDGSKDNSWNVICNLTEEYSYVRGISFSRNFGKEAAMYYGLLYAKGKCCAIIDCDLQQPPEVLVKMHKLWKDEHFEIVEGVKKSRGKEGKIYKLFSKMFYSIISKTSGIDLKNSSDFKLLDRKVVDEYLQLSEKNIFFRALSKWLGYKSVSIEFEVQSRQIGETKWSFYSLAKYAVVNITSFTSLPLLSVLWLGVFTFCVSLVLGAQSLIRYMLGASLEGFTTVLLLILFIGSIIMISLGIIGFYLSKIYDEIKRRPKAIIRESVGFEDNEKNS